MAGSEVLREYLFSLGFKTDPVKVDKFDKTLQGLETGAMRLGKSLVGVATGAQAMAAQFAFSMEKLYYASQRTRSTVGNLQALRYAGSQVGASADAVQNAVESMTRAMRSNPGYEGLLNNLGVSTQNREGVEILRDLLDVLSKMPSYQAEAFAKQFGIDPDTLFTLTQSLDAMDAIMAKRKEMAASAGLDTEAAAAAGKKYAQQLREIYELLGMLKDQAAVSLLPVFEKLASTIRDTIMGAMQLLRDLKSGEFLGNAKAAGGALLQHWKETLAPTKGAGTGSIKDIASRLWEGIAGSTGGGVKLAERTAKAAGGADDKQRKLSSLERQYGLPDGLLYRMWMQESGGGKRMRSPAGAMGHFQFMPATAKEYGLKDPDDFDSSADAAGRKMRDLMGAYGGDITKALAAYNWGNRGVNRAIQAGQWGPNALPRETLGYVQKVGGVTITQQNTFQISGANSPEATAKAAGREIDRSNNVLVRDLQGAVR